jgi:phosphopentomutase
MCPRTRTEAAYTAPVQASTIVLDSVGAGALPDAATFGDEGAHTLNHTLEATGLTLPNLAALGLGRVPTVRLPPAGRPLGSWGRMRERSRGKDTSTGHWEFAGVVLEHPFKTFAGGFPEPVMARFSEAIGRGWLCNRPYSGTDVIRDYGEEHIRTWKPIVYTSADSVFQVAAHQDVVPLETLYAWCRAARAILTGEHAVARVIARPFRGAHPFVRANEARKDFSLEPPPNVLDALFEAGKDVIGIGKIPDIYANRGFTRSIHTDDNADGIEKTLGVMRSRFDGLALCNLVDFDARYGHRRDPRGLRPGPRRVRREAARAHGRRARGRRPLPRLRPRQRPHLARHRPHPRARPPPRIPARPRGRGPRRARELRRPRRDLGRGARRGVGGTGL